MDVSITSFVGIDVAKHSLDFCILPEEKQFTIDYNTQELKKLAGQLPQAGTCLIVIEATGGYQRRLVTQLVQDGHLVAVVNPRQVRNFAKGLGILAKTDRLDAQVIAKFGQHVRPRLLAKTHEKQQELSELVTRRRHTTMSTCRSANRRKKSPGNNLFQAGSKKCSTGDRCFGQTNQAGRKSDPCLDRNE